MLIEHGLWWAKGGMWRMAGDIAYLAMVNLGELEPLAQLLVHLLHARLLLHTPRQVLLSRHPVRARARACACGCACNMRIWCLKEDVSSESTVRVR